MIEQVNHFKRLLDTIIKGGTLGDQDVEIVRKISLINILSIIAIVSLVPLGISALLIGNSTLGIFDLIVASVLIASQFYLRKTGKYKHGIYLGVAFPGALFFYLFVTGGIENSGHVWFYTFPMFSAFLLGSKRGAITSLTLLCLSILFLSIDSSSQTLTVYSLHFKIRFTASYLVVLLFSYFFEAGRKATQDRLTLNNRELMNVNEQLTRAYEELESTQLQLIQSSKLASIGELAAGVAHELNQPLMVMRGAAQLAIRNIKKNRVNTSGIIEQLKPLEKNSRRMMNIINHLRTFSRQSSSKFIPVDVNQIIDESFLMIGEQLKLRNIEIIKDLSVDLPKINGDANQLEQVFLNLIANSRDAITSIAERRMGGGDLKKNKTNSGFKGRLEIITRIGEKDNQKSKHFIEILVRDNGNGIPDDKVYKIFDPFFTTKETGKGTGLGLSISYGIIKDHGGEIHVADTGREGTTFRISLPIDNC